MRFRIALTMMLTAVLAGCDTTRATSRQLARVAKDWCLTIRASQVIPIYPLTEDLEPGDVFLVRTPIEEQIRVYEGRGFLPLENLLTRCHPNGYAAFYQGAYGTAGQTNTPHHWQFSDDPAVTNGWNRAPRAAFPSYTFSVRRGAGMSLALPVQGVPVAMSLLGTGQAHGSVELADAYTYGLDLRSIHKQVENWALQRANKNFLSQFEPASNQTNYLRVVDRVYLVGRVNVSVMNDEASGVAISGGAPKPVDLLNSSTADGGTNYVAVMTALAKNIEGAALPGGTLKLAAASSRSVTMVESFPRPLVIGYIAFDLPILSNGDIGSPVLTQSRLAGSKLSLAKARVNEKYDAVERIIQYVDPQGTGKVDGVKIGELSKGTGLAIDWAGQFVGISVEVLRNDLRGDDYEYIPALIKNLPK